jgi:hypothetical protein
MDFRLPPAAHSVNVNLEDYEVKPSSCLCLSEINSHMQMMKSAEKWRRQNATNGM